MFDELTHKITMTAKVATQWIDAIRRMDGFLQELADALEKQVELECPDYKPEEE